MDIMIIKNIYNLDLLMSFIKSYLLFQSCLILLLDLMGNYQMDQIIKNFNKNNQ